MCVEVVIGGREFDRLGPLLALLPHGVVASPAYADAGLDPDACLCQLDIGATAERNGFRPVDPDGSMIRVEFQADEPQEAGMIDAALTLERRCEECEGKGATVNDYTGDRYPCGACDGTGAVMTELGEHLSAFLLNMARRAKFRGESSWPLA